MQGEASKEGIAMQLVLCEKPSVGQSIARTLGASGRKEGYMEGNG